MKTKIQTSANHNSVVPNSPPAPSGFTLGLDLGDRAHHVCVLDAAGNLVREVSLPNTRPALAQLLADFPRSTVALEAGTLSVIVEQAYEQNPFNDEVQEAKEFVDEWRKRMPKE